MSNLFEKQNKPFAIKLSERVKEEIKKEFGSKRWNFQITNYFIYVNQDTWSFSINLPNYTLITEAEFFGDGSNKLRENLKNCVDIDQLEQINDDFAVKFAEFCNDLLFNCSEQYDGKTTTELLQIFKTQVYGK